VYQIKLKFDLKSFVSSCSDTWNRTGSQYLAGAFLGFKNIRGWTRNIRGWGI